MGKVTLDKETFKALASESRLEILRSLDGKALSLKEISRMTNLNKATLHEHLKKLTDAGLVKKKSRPGHKWVYYRLSWKGESLLHPENTKIVVMFSTSFFVFLIGVIQVVQYIKNLSAEAAATYYRAKGTPDGNGLMLEGNQSTFNDMMNGFTGSSGSEVFLWIAIGCFTCFIILFTVSTWYLKKNRGQKL